MFAAGRGAALQARFGSQQPKKTPSSLSRTIPILTSSFTGFHRTSAAISSSSSPSSWTSGFQGDCAPQLQAWLGRNGVDTSCYGKGTAKTVDDLLEEAKRKESRLDTGDDGKALRVVKVLSLWILNQRGQILFEDEQILPDGRSRCRNLALSEKLIGDENWRDAVARAVQEELGSILPSLYEVTIFDDTYKLLTHRSTSMSYPGLTTHYLFHRVTAKVTGLPEGSFSTFEERPGGQLTSRWVWRDPVEIPLDPASPESSSSSPQEKI